MRAKPRLRMWPMQSAIQSTCCSMEAIICVFTPGLPVVTTKKGGRPPPPTCFVRRSPSVKTQMIASIEQHVDWIADCIAVAGAGPGATIEASAEAEARWVAFVNATAENTIYLGCKSWYIGANIPGKPHVFMPYVGGFDRYKRHCDAIAAKGYEGFVLSTREARASAAELR